jgi:hypothetical protein
MNDPTLAQAQADMRRGYLSGAPGVVVSGFMWLAAGMVAVLSSETAAVLALLAGGALIHPLSVVFTKLLGHSGGHSSGNPLGRLAGETTVTLLVGLVIAYGMSLVRVEWFFPAVLMIIGGRYLAFQTLYGLRIYWACGAVLCMAGLALGLTRAPVPAGAFAGAAIELVAGLLILNRARSHDAA